MLALIAVNPMMARAYSQRFLDCLPLMLINECPLPGDWSNPKNFSNDAHDPGGRTMCGIIEREYDAYRARKNLPLQSVRLISREEGEDIYYNDYWLPYCALLPHGLDLSFFDEAVNAGPRMAVKLLQRTLSIADDGRWGAQTQRAVEGADGTPDGIAKAIAGYADYRAASYRSMHGFQYFGRSWLSRTAAIKSNALNMVA